MIASIVTKKRFYCEKTMTSKIRHQKNKIFKMKYERR